MDGGQWEETHLALVDPRANPNAPHVVAFGVDGVHRNTVARLGTLGSFDASLGVSPADALREILAVRADDMAPGDDGPTVVLPREGVVPPLLLDDILPPGGAPLTSPVVVLPFSEIGSENPISRGAS